MLHRVSAPEHWTRGPLCQKSSCSPDAVGMTATHVAFADQASALISTIRRTFANRFDICF